MYVMSYCLIFIFDKSLKMHKIVIYRSFQQMSWQLYNPSHFRQEHVPFYDRTTLRQLKDAASAILSREKCTSLAEVFSIELKFTIDILKSWNTRIMKREFFELDSYDKKKKNGEKKPLWQKTLFALYMIFLWTLNQKMVGLTMSLRQRICF